MGASIHLRPSHLPGEFSSWSGGPQQDQELSWPVELRERPCPPPIPWGPPRPLLSCSGPGGSQEPRRLRDCPLAFPGLGPGPPPRPLPELWVEKPTLREWPCLLSGREGFISKTAVREPRAPPHREGAALRGAPWWQRLRSSLAPTPSLHPAGTTLWLQTVMPRPSALDGPQCRTVPLAFCPR